MSSPHRCHASWVFARCTAASLLMEREEEKEKIRALAYSDLGVHGSWPHVRCFVEDAGQQSHDPTAKRWKQITKEAKEANTQFGIKRFNVIRTRCTEVNHRPH